MKCLVDSKKIPEAAFFALSYCPSKLPPLTEQWNKMIAETSKSQYKSIIVTVLMVC